LALECSATEEGEENKKKEEEDEDTRSIWAELEFKSSVTLI